MTVKPPHNISERDFSKKSIFLAGSIEMGKATPWQGVVYMHLNGNYNLFNPRRNDWDLSWEQPHNNPQFNQQVNWELNALEKADYIIMYLEPGTKSPISLLELGLYVNSGKLHVVCPEGFWRKGNVDIVCARYDIPMYNSITEVINYFKYLSDVEKRN